MMKTFSEQTQFVVENLADVLTDAILNHGRDAEVMKSSLSEFISKREYKLDRDIVECAKVEGYDLLSELVYDIMTEENKKNLHPELAKLANLETGKEYTLFMYNDFGFPLSMKIKLDSVSVERYAQYPNAIKTTFKRKNKRYSKQQYEMYLLPYQTVIVWNGHREVESNMWGEVKKETEHVTVRESKGKSFDPLYVQCALDSLEESPVVQYVK